MFCMMHMFTCVCAARIHQRKPADQSLLRITDIGRYEMNRNYIFLEPGLQLVDEGYDLIINCSGIGSKELVPDEGVFPIRGQIHMVDAPWIRSGFVMIDSGHYILPK